MSPMHRIFCSTGALLGRPNGRDFRLLPSLTAQLRCNGYELMFYTDWYAQVDDLLRTVVPMGLSIPVLHCEKSIGEKLTLGDAEAAFQGFAVNCRVAQAVGAEKLVLHLWNGRPSDGCIQRNLDAWPRLNEMARQHGLLLMVENVVCTQQDPMIHLQALCARPPEAALVFDTKMAAFHSQLNALYAPENAWRTRCIRHYHVNDYGGGHLDWQNLRTLPIGDGRIDFAPLFRHIRTSGYAGDFTIEATAFDASGAVDTAMLNRQVDILRAGLADNG